jgi:hypothetical protein
MEPNLLVVTLHARQPEAGLADFVVDSVLRVTFLSGRQVLAARHDHTGRIGGTPGRKDGADVRHEASFRSEGSPRSRMVPDDPGGFSTVGTTVGDGSKEPILLAVFFMPVSPRSWRMPQRTALNVGVIRLLVKA